MWAGALCGSRASRQGGQWARWIRGLIESRAGPGWKWSDRRAASLVCSSVLPPVTTILPLPKISAVVFGSRIRITTAANLCAATTRVPISSSRLGRPEPRMEEAQLAGVRAMPRGYCSQRHGNQRRQCHEQSLPPPSPQTPSRVRRRRRRPTAGAPLSLAPAMRYLDALEQRVARPALRYKRRRRRNEKAFSEGGSPPGVVLSVPRVHRDLLQALGPELHTCAGEREGVEGQAAVSATARLRGARRPARAGRGGKLGAVKGHAPMEVVATMFCRVGASPSSWSVAASCDD